MALFEEGGRKEKALFEEGDRKGKVCLLV